MSKTISDLQASQLAMLLDALGSTPYFDDELRTLTWLATWERHNVENVAELFRRCRQEVAGLERRNRQLLRDVAELEQQREGFRDTALYYSALVGEHNRRLTSEQADAAHARSCSCGDRAAHEAEDGSDYTLAEQAEETGLVYARNKAREAAIKREQAEAGEQ